MTLNNCASMKLEVHFQSKQVSYGTSGVSVLVATWRAQDTHKALENLTFRVTGIGNSALF